MLRLWSAGLRGLSSAKYSDWAGTQPVYDAARQWTRLSDLTSALVGQKVWLRARVQSTRMKGKGGFLVLRDSLHTAQCVVFVTEAVSKEFVKFVGGIAPESVVDVYGVCKAPQVPIAKCSQSLVEVDVEEVHVVSRAASPLPMQLADASAPISLEDESPEASSDDSPKRAKVTLKTRLDHRFLDLRTGASSSLIRLSATVTQTFRSHLASLGFLEVHTPKLLPGASEGGANIFTLDYFGKQACLAQSPQLHKQMAVMGDLDRVYEVGPVFRAEDSNTHRHLCEFTGMDLEMTIKTDYHEVIEVVQSLFLSIFHEIEQRNALELSILRSHFPYLTPFCVPPKPQILTFPQAVQLLTQSGYPQSPLSDLSSDAERHLGKVIKTTTGSDFYIIHRYPTSVRPFYTLPCSDDPAYSCSFDVFMRGEEVVSGGQREHNAERLEKRIQAAGIGLEGLKDYVEAFRYGAFPHAGCGIGLERVVMLYLGLGNIRRVSLFPRDPKRISP